jgi:transcriptional regulator with XRE-family HTH domain
MEIHEAIAKIIRKRRQDFKMSQEELADAAGLSIFRTGQIERGDNKIRLEEVTAIGKALHLNTVGAWILIGKELGE